MNQAESDRWARHSYDPEPQPGDGPEYHAEHQYWLERHPGVRKERMAYDDLPAVLSNKIADEAADVARRESVDKPKRENPHNPVRFDVTIEVTAAELAELEKTFHPKKVIMLDSRVMR